MQFRQMTEAEPALGDLSRKSCREVREGLGGFCFGQLARDAGCAESAPCFKLGRKLSICEETKRLGDLERIVGLKLDLPRSLPPLKLVWGEGAEVEGFRIGHW